MVTEPLHGALSGAFPHLLYAPAADFNGSDNVLLQVNYGALPSYQAQIRLVINPVNDGPEFTIGTQINATDESLAQTIANWATSIRPGPTDAMDEAGQAIAFTVTNDNGGLFNEPPAINAAGTLTLNRRPMFKVKPWCQSLLRTAAARLTVGSTVALPRHSRSPSRKARVWHNAMNGLDVNGDGHIAPDDVLDVINSINAFGGQKVPKSGMPLHHIGMFPATDGWPPATRWM